MPSITELLNFKNKLKEMDPDDVLDLLKIDSEMLVEMAENYDPLCITEAFEREEGEHDDRDPIEWKASNKKEAIKA